MAGYLLCLLDLCFVILLILVFLICVVCWCCLRSWVAVIDSLFGCFDCDLVRFGIRCLFCVCIYVVDLICYLLGV